MWQVLGLDGHVRWSHHPAVSLDKLSCQGAVMLCQHATLPRFYTHQVNIPPPSTPHPCSSFSSLSAQPSLSSLTLTRPGCCRLLAPPP